MFTVAFLDRKIADAIHAPSFAVGPCNMVWATENARYANAPDTNTMGFVYNNCKKVR